MIELHNIDNMEYMAGCKDNQFDLAIVDPPYGIGEGGGKDRRRKSRHKKKDWDNSIPDQVYFDELFRVSKNQIIWGANYFIDKFNINSMGWIFWDKKKQNSDFSDGELAFTSFGRALKMFSYSKTGGNVKEFKNKFKHPCEKPVALYKWLLKNYAKEGDKILDTHLGSGSIAIACHDMGFDLVGCELDKDYFESAQNRLKIHTDQNTFF